MLDTATQQAFLRALEDQPDFRAAVRRHLLTSELIELPERFAEYSAAVDRRLTSLETTLANFMESTEQRLTSLETTLANFMESTERRLTSLETTLANFMESTERRLQALERGQDELKADMAEVKTELAQVHIRLDSMDRRMDRMDGRMDNGFGTNYEIKAANNFGSIAGRYLRLRRTRVLKAAAAPDDGNLSGMIADAEDRGAITEAEADDLLAVDLIARGRSRDNGHDVYVAAEVSITVSDEDIARAAARAEYLAKTVGQVAVPAVVGENIAPEQEELARQRSVTVMRLPAS